MIVRRFPCATVLILLAAFQAAGCRTIYYETMESFGKEKRDLLASRVEAAREAQEKAKEQFRDAYEEFKALVGYEGGELEDRYQTLSKEFERSDERAAEVRERIDEVERVGKDLFKEWSKELKSYQDQNLRRDSEEKLLATETRFNQLLLRLQRAEREMDPVLNTFRDHVLYLKHNLNARAVGELRGTVVKLENDMGRLLRDMEAAIAEARDFEMTLR